MDDFACRPLVKHLGPIDGYAPPPSVNVNKPSRGEGDLIESIDETSIATTNIFYPLTPPPSSTLVVFASPPATPGTFALAPTVLAPISSMALRLLSAGLTMASVLTSMAPSSFVVPPSDSTVIYFGMPLCSSGPNMSLDQVYTSQEGKSLWSIGYRPD